jgi:hypothetical protein
MSWDCTISRGNRVFFEVKNDQVTFHSKLEEKQLSFLGIPIPAYIQKEFGGKQFVRKDDPLFARALVQVYFENVLKKIGFHLVPKNDCLTNQMRNLNISEN